MRRRALLALGGAGAWVFGPSRALTLAPPRLVVAYPPGGISDATARLLAQALGEQLGGPLLVENRAGAGGLAALEALLRAPPDGRTLCYSAISPLLERPALARLAPVIAIMDTPMLLLAHPDFPPDTLTELLALARREPGRVRWASSGPGTVGHRVLERIAAAAGVEITHVPYKGGGQQLTDALGGQFELLSSNVAAQQLQYLRQGRLKALAVGAPARLAVLPEVPTLAELGFAPANLLSSFGIFAPPATPPTRIAALNTAFDRVLALPRLRQPMLDAGSVPVGGRPQALAWRIEQQREPGR
ncbi:MAG: tripartite tricarboxylate transporter substrate binding protein [Burkholderiaceae bacterium]